MMVNHIEDPFSGESYIESTNVHDALTAQPEIWVYDPVTDTWMDIDEVTAPVMVKQCAQDVSTHYVIMVTPNNNYYITK